MVIRGPIPDRKFLDVRFGTLRDVAVVGLIPCERVVLGKSAKVLINKSAQGMCPPHIMEEEADGQEEKQDDKREDRHQEEESGEIEENQTHKHQRMKMKHEMM